MTIMERMNANVNKVLASWWEALAATLMQLDKPNGTQRQSDKSENLLPMLNRKSKQPAEKRWASGLMATLLRMVAYVVQMVLIRLPGCEPAAGNRSKSKSIETDTSNDDHDPQEAGETQSWTKLLICIAVDAVGASYYVYPLLPWFCYSYIWAPVAALVIQGLHKNTCLSIFAGIEELLPFLDLCPSATIGYLLHNEKMKETKEIAEAECIECDCAGTGNEVFKQAIKQGFVPIDHFFLDVLTYCVLAYLLTVVVLMTPSFSTFCIELIILALIFIDTVPDIVFEGMQRAQNLADDQKRNARSPAAGTSGSKQPVLKRSLSTKVIQSQDDSGKRRMKLSLVTVMEKGFKKYIKNSG